MRQAVKWQAKVVHKEKALIREELKEGASDRQLEIILRQIDQLEGSEDPKSQMRRLLYVISALVHQSKYAKLRESQINRLVDLGHAILKVQRIEPVKSTLAFLYGELHLALSQIYRRSGQHWRAAWEQQMAYQLARRDLPGGVEFFALGRGIRSLRLGLVKTAIDEFLLAERSGLKGQSLNQARMYRIMALRVSGQIEESQELAQASCDQLDFSEREAKELAWEGFCRQAQRDHDIGPIVTATKRGGSHYETTYITEAHLWVRALNDKRWQKRLPKLFYLKKNKVIDYISGGQFLKSALVIEKCYDEGIPYTFRLRELGETLARTEQLVSIDKELLVWCAAYRWLTSAKSPSLATLCLGQYQGLSLKLSSGQTRDVLGIGLG